VAAETSSSDIAFNLARVRERIANAALRAGRPSDSIKLVAVTKTKSIDVVKAAVAAGQKIFGENYAQEFATKAEILPQLDWHFIGSLQSNKVRLVVGRASLIESVDRFNLGEAIARAAVARGCVQDILVQVHIGDEGTKHGVAPSEGADLVSRLASLDGLRVRGLMSLPPLADTERVGRARFAELRSYLDTWKTQLPTAAASVFTEASIGTSADYEWAILEGATLVRVGTVLFGPRETNA
jgi:PLP dependent protein